MFIQAICTDFAFKSNFSVIFLNLRSQELIKNIWLSVIEFILKTDKLILIKDINAFIFVF